MKLYNKAMKMEYIIKQFLCQLMWKNGKLNEMQCIKKQSHSLFFSFSKNWDKPLLYSTNLSISSWDRIILVQYNGEKSVSELGGHEAVEDKVEAAVEQRQDIHHLPNLVYIGVIVLT